LVFKLFDVVPPNHFGYVQFPAALLIIFGLMFFEIARDPLEKTLFIPYGIALKFSYVFLVFWYWFFSDIPNMWKPFALIDIAFMLSFIWCYYTLKSLKMGMR
jgi:hypothetical protein